MKTFAFDIYRYMPKNYFRYSQASLMYIDYVYNVYADLISKLGDDDNIPVKTTLRGNTITDNLNMQVITFSSNRYGASILDF